MLARMPPTERWPSSCYEAGLAAPSQERLVELGVRQRERHVHPGAARRWPPDCCRSRSRSMAPYSIAALARLRSRHRREAALALDPLEHQAGDVPGERRRRVEHRAVVRHRLAVEHRRRVRARACPSRSSRTITTHEARGPDVLLRAGIDHAEAARHRSAATGSSTTCRRPAARRRCRERTETRRRRWSRSACSAGTPRPACAATAHCAGTCV